MSEPFIGEIRLFGFNFAPRGWARCEGQLLPISSHTALFSLLGTTYGGDGRTTFGLPDLRGRAAIGIGQGPGLSNRVWGQKSGSENTILNTTQIPSHSHEVRCSVSPSNQTSPVGNSIAANESGDNTKRFSDQNPAAPMNAGSVAPNGGGGAHTNMQPFLAMNYSIALTGIFPSRN